MTVSYNTMKTKQISISDMIYEAQRATLPESVKVRCVNSMGL